MRHAHRKVNFLIEEDVAREMEDLIPSGKRSKVVNEALRKELQLIKRRSAVENILAESGRGRKLGTAAIVAGLASDRKGH